MNEQMLKEKVCREIRSLEEDMTATVQKIVRIPSVVGQEGKAQDFMEQLYQSSDLEVIRFQPDIAKVRNHPAFSDSGMSYEHRPNIIGRLEGHPDSLSMILNGHIDVVSPEPISAWKHDPWGGEIDGGRLYGRGATDMKGGLIANFFALQGIRNAGIKPRGSVMLQSVIDEEASGAGGTLACLMGGYRADGILCTEPHNFSIMIAHVGINWFRVRVQGKISHAGWAHLGVNAIGKMFPIYQALMELDRKRAAEIRFPLIEKINGRSCNLNIGTMKAGDWPSNVAGSAEMECRIGFVPGEKMEDVRLLVERTIQETAQGDPWLREHPPEVEWFGWKADPWSQNPDNSFVQTLKRAAEGILGREVEYIGRSGVTDCRFAQYFRMAAATMGLNAHEGHGVDEYINISELVPLAQILAMTVLDWCGYEE